MPKWLLIFHLNPPGAFGLPDGDKVVVPAGTDLEGGWFHTPTMTLVGQASVPLYRRQEDALTVQFQLRNSEVTITDNVVQMKVEATDASMAASDACNDLTRYLRHLSLTNGQLYSYQLMVFECLEPERSLYPSTGAVKLIAAIAYDLGKLRQDMLDTLREYELSDDRLDRALAYWEHALFLYENREKLAEPGSRHYRALAASVILNFWKAITTIVGDSSERDYQSRYRSFGLGQEFFKSSIEKVKQLRDSYDVAHYSLTPKTEDLQGEIHFARETAGEVLRAYRRTLDSARAGQK